MDEPLTITPAEIGYLLGIKRTAVYNRIRRAKLERAAGSPVNRPKYWRVEFKRAFGIETAPEFAGNDVIDGGEY